MNPTCLYRHRNCLDVDMFIMRVVSETNESLELKVSWLHRFYGWFFNKVDTVIVQKKDLKNWKLVV